MTEAEKLCREVWRAAPEAKWAWCCHHSILLERLTEPASHRIDYIVGYKLPTEIERRLNNFRPVLSKLLTRRLDKAQDTRVKAWDACHKVHDKTWDARAKAWDGYFEALNAYDKAMEPSPELLALHRIDVPHNTWNGEGIF
jgi:hypothetical protein